MQPTKVIQLPSYTSAGSVAKSLERALATGNREHLAGVARVAVIRLRILEERLREAANGTK